jgi:hypothetical protein
MMQPNRRPTRPVRPTNRVFSNPTKKGVITRKLNGILYDIMIRTVTDQVFDSEGYTLTERLYDIMQALSRQTEDINRIVEQVNEILLDAPEEFNSFKEIFDYVNVDGNPKSKLIELIDDKESIDHAEEMHQVLLDAINDTREEFNSKYQVLVETIRSLVVRIETLEGQPNIIMTRSNEIPEGVKVGDIWYQITSEDV